MNEWISSHFSAIALPFKEIDRETEREKEWIELNGSAMKSSMFHIWLPSWNWIIDIVRIIGVESSRMKSNDSNETECFLLNPSSSGKNGITDCDKTQIENFPPAQLDVDDGFLFQSVNSNNINSIIHKCSTTPPPTCFQSIENRKKYAVRWIIRLIRSIGWNW